ncbi:MaoC family dehydratase [Singulisphaera sp. PoT]|uniref:MaoC family dehydratase n=1 Tax=Singulisphaera sp. PoT TaxID=3411797 RepID=UPI003BF554E7
MSSGMTFEDFALGQTYRSGPVTMELTALKAFSAEFDPQPFHLDEEAGKASFFGGLVASGWHTAALTMKLLTSSDLKVEGGLIGVGIDELKWPRPVKAGDRLTLELEVIRLRTLKSRDDKGLLTVQSTTKNQDGEPVLTMIVNMIVPRRPS